MSAPVVWRPARLSFGAGSFGVTPVTAADLKAHARVDFADEDAAVEDYLAAAADMVERRTGRLLTERAVTLALPSFPARIDQEIELPGGRCASVSSVAYADSAGEALTLDAEDYYLDAARTPARLGLAGGSLWPVTRPWGLPVTISYVAGYVADAAPPLLLQAVRLLATEMFDQRRDAVVGASVSPAALAAERCMEPWLIREMF